MGNRRAGGERGPRAHVARRAPAPRAPIDSASEGVRAGGVVHTWRMNEDEFGVETALEDQQATVTLRGEVDLSAKPRVLDVLASIADAGAKSVVFDLAAVSFLDSSGLGAMLHARHLGLALTLRNPTPRVERLLELVVLGELVEIQRTA